MAKKTKVLFLMDAMIMGGLEMVLKNLLDELKHFDELDITVGAHVKEKFFRKYFKENRDKIKLIRSYPKRGAFRKLLWPLFERHVKKALAETDIVVDYRNGENHHRLQNFTGKKIIWIHGGINYFKTDCAYTLDWADLIVCLTDEFKKDFISAFPKHKNKIAHIYNASPYPEIAKRAKTDFAPNLGGGGYFVSVTRIDVGQKDVATTIRAFDKFWQDNNRPDVRLYLIGGGRRKKEMQDLADTMPSGKNIIFTGIVAEPFGYMHKSLANILSSRYEGLPTTLIEAAAAGTMNIASDCKSGPREILLDGKAGLLFPIGDVNALAKHMSDIYNKKVNRKKMIENGTKALSRFDAKTVAKQVLKILK